MVMESLRFIDTSNYPTVAAPSSFGKPARLEWLAIKQLVIDPEYQRVISDVGRKNVVKIAANFDWSKFMPVIVASAGGNKFAIVDGQHRTTSAALCGIERVPCCIIDAARGEQAAAFKAINGNTTRMHTTSLFHASLAAGEADAQRIALVCARAGIKIMRYPKPVSAMETGETIAVSSIRKIVAQFGDDVSVLALTMLKSAGGGIPGSLKQQSIFGTAEVLADHPKWCADEKKLKAAFSDFDIPVMLMDAFEQAAKRHGVSPINCFEAAMIELLAESFGEARAA